MRSKYLSPAAYVRKLRLTVAEMVLGWGIPLNTSTAVDGHKVRFSTNSFVEYFLRAEESYTREKVTMDWIRTYIEPNDIVYDVGAIVGAYSLLFGKIVAQGTPENIITKNKSFTGKYLKSVSGIKPKKESGKIKVIPRIHKNSQTKNSMINNSFIFPSRPETKKVVPRKSRRFRRRKIKT